MLHTNIRSSNFPWSPEYSSDGVVLVFLPVAIESQGNIRSSVSAAICSSFFTIADLRAELVLEMYRGYCAEAVAVPLFARNVTCLAETNTGPFIDFETIVGVCKK